jgi:hypothetical protein
MRKKRKKAIGSAPSLCMLFISCNSNSKYEAPLKVPDSLFKALSEVHS